MKSYRTTPVAFRFLEYLEPLRENLIEKNILLV